jgi:hypothetical protein
MAIDQEHLFDGVGLAILGAGLILASTAVGPISEEIPGFHRVRRLWTLLDLERFHKDWAVTLVLVPLSILMAIYCVFGFPKQAFIDLDSATYLNFHIQRPLLYPVFLRLGVALFGDVKSVVVLQTVLGMGAIIFLAECLQRVFKNYLISLPLGIGLLINWPIFEFGSFVLADYLFLAFSNLYLGTVFLALRKVTPKKLVSIAVFISLAVWTKPVGIVLALVLPVLLIANPSSWRAVTKWLGAPLVGLLVLQASVNLFVFDYFGIARFSGAPMLVNTMYILKPDTPYSEKALIASLYEAAAPKQRAIWAIPDWKQRTRRLHADTNPTIGEGMSIISQFMSDSRNSLKKTDTKNHVAVVAAFNRLSPLNSRFAELGQGTDQAYAGLDAEMERLWWASLLHNPTGFTKLFTTKFFASWVEPFHLFYAPVDLGEHFSRYLVLEPELPDLGFGGRAMARAGSVAVSSFGASVLFFANGVVRALLLGARGPGIAAVVAFASIFGILYLRYRRREIRADLACLGCAGIFAITYLAAVNYAHVPMGRYTMVVLPAMMVMTLAPLQLFIWVPRLRRKKTSTDCKVAR